MKELWEKAAGGDKKAEDEIFAFLRERFAVLVGLLIKGDDVEDISQEACAAVLKGYKSLKSPFEYNAWALKILRHKIADYFQKRAVEDKFLSSKYSNGLDGPDAAVYDNHEIMHNLVECLRELIRGFPRYARVLNLVQQGYGTEEICERMTISRNNLYVLLSRGRKVLKDCISYEEGQ